MKAVRTSTIYDNPLPQLRSRQGFFPSIFELSDGRIGALTVIGEAFESVDSACYVSYSSDGGKSFGAPRRILVPSESPDKTTVYAKITALKNGRLVALGYAFPRDNPELPLGNPENGGLIDDYVFYAVSDDGGESFSEIKQIDTSFSPHVEASAPITELSDGSWITPITCFPDWSGRMHSDLMGRALYSPDCGETWSDSGICMSFGDRRITCYEQRMCQLESGTLITIGWNEDTVTGERLCNHYTASYDNGKTWTYPESCGVLGQASSVCALGGERLLALHAVRRDTDRPGIYAYVVDFSDRTWRVTDSALIWEPSTPIVKDSKMAEIFSFLKFGQPGAIKLSDGDVLMAHWYCDQGQYRTVATRISL